MSEVKRYWVPCGSMNMDGWHQDDNEVVLAGEHDKAMKAAQSELAALREELAKFDEGMRWLACSLGAGGFNAESLTADELVGKVKWGVNDLINEFEKGQQNWVDGMKRLTDAEQRNAELAELLQKGFNCMEQSGGKYRITMDFRTGDECFEAYSAICNLCHCDSLVREPQPTESGASE